jgi:signal transduction histidine kinase
MRITNEQSDKRHLKPELSGGTAKSSDDSDFRSELSHALRGPLTSIRGLLGLIDDGTIPAGSDEAAELIQTALSSTNRLISLIEETLGETKTQEAIAAATTPAAAPGGADASRMQIPNQSDFSAPRERSVTDREKIIRVLMVEDEVEYYRFIHELLAQHRDCQFELAHARSISKSDEYLRWSTPDLILLDLGLPDGAGLLTLQRIRELSPEIPIVVLTGSDNQLIAESAIALGAQDYLIKHNISNYSLIRCINYAIERRRFEVSDLRLSAIRDFTGMLAHDMKVPLTGMKTVLDGLASGGFGRLLPEQQEVIRGLAVTNEMQLGLVEKLLEVYWFDTVAQNLPFESLDVRDLLLKCISDIESRSRGAMPIRTSLPEFIPQIFGNKHGLERMFANLLDNAVKFSDGGRPVTVSVDVCQDKMAIEFHNLGTPVPDEVKSGMFDRFWQGMPGKMYVAHTGLGLYLCQRIASHHKARIACHSSLEEGTKISVRFGLS